MVFLPLLLSSAESRSTLHLACFVCLFSPNVGSEDQTQVQQAFYQLWGYEAGKLLRSSFCLMSTECWAQEQTETLTISQAVYLLPHRVSVITSELGQTNLHQSAQQLFPDLLLCGHPSTLLA